MSIQVIDKGWKRIQAELKKMHGASVKVGYPQEKAKEHAGKAPVDIATLAAIHEFGTSTIPARTFLSQAFDTNLPRVRELIERERSEIFRGARTVRVALQRIGVFYKGAIQKTFLSGNFEPLKSQTIRRKGSSRPLVDTGQLRQSVDFEVVEGS